MPVVVSVLAFPSVVYGSASFTVNCTNRVVNAVDSVTVVGCLLPGGGSYSGDVDVVETPTQVLLKMTSGSFTGSNAGTDPVVSATYFLMGEGIELAALDGTLGVLGDFTDGTENFAVAVEGTSFSNNPANAFWTGPGAGVAIPIPVTAGPNVVQGDFSGTGTALLYVKYSVGGGTAYTFTSSVDGDLDASPEPSTFALLSAPLAVLIWKQRRRTRPI